MNDIYQRQGLTNVANEVSPGTYNTRVANKMSKGVMKEGYQELQEGRNIELQAQEISSDSDIKNLYENPELSSNPAALGEELDKISTSYVNALETEDQKIEYLANFELKKSSYLNQATANMEKAKTERDKSIAFNSVYSSIDSMGTSFGNGISGVYNEDDIVNYQSSYQNMSANINKKNPDGTFVFGDHQRKKMKDDLDERLLDSVKDRFDVMTESQRDNFIKQMEEDSFVLAKMGSGEEEQNLYLKDAVDTSLYADIKRYAKKADKAARNAKIQEYNLLKRESEVNFLTNPTQANLDKLVSLNPTMSDNTFDKYEELIASDVDINYDANTTFEKYSEAEKDLVKIGNMPSDTPEEVEKLVDATANYMLKLKKSNREGGISTEDDADLRQAAIMAMGDATFKERLEKLPDMTGFAKMARVLDPSQSYLLQRVGANDKIEKIGLQTSSAILKATMEGADDKEIAKIYSQGMQDAVKAKYYYIPELKGDLTPNESVINLNGKPYLFKGWGSFDILVEAK